MRFLNAARFLLYTFLVILPLSLYTVAQTPNFSGEWTLDKAKSKLDERQTASIESQTLKSEHTEIDLKVTITTKRNNGGIGGNRVDLGGGVDIYRFDGRENIVERESEIGRITIKYKAEAKDDTLKLQISRTFNTANGETTIITKELWELSPDNKKLTIKREVESPRGSASSELAFFKKD